MPTLFLAFANNDKNYLETLRVEDSKVNDLLNERKLRGDFIVHSEQFATSENIIKGLRQFKDDIVLFLYSGHAGHNTLELEDGEANAEGIAALLGRCPNLKLVVLNGCSTAGQVDNLFNNNVPIVIATSAPIDDQRATQFSITFFEELVEKRQSIKIACENAVDTAKVKGNIDFEIRSRKIGYAKSEHTDKPLWGLYFKEDKVDLIDTWRLPEKVIETKTNQYLVNAIEGIYEEYAEALKAQGEESRGQDVILKRLPYSISEPIRKLLAPNDNSGQLFYDRPSLDRYNMLLYAYQNIIAFITYVLLAQLWEQKRLHKKDLNTEGVTEFLKAWLNKDFQSDNKRSHLGLFRQLVAFFEQKDIGFFLTELKEVLSILKDDETKEAIEFLEKQVSERPKSDMDFLCDKTEAHLAVILYQFGFLIHYGLTSVKDINVLFYQHSDEPDFEHKIVKLQQALTNLEDRTESEKTYHKTATILLRRIDDKTKYLYLSPFFIDENAYTKSPKAKLCSFVAYDTVQKHFHFRHISKPEDLIKIEKKKISALARIKGESDQNDNYYPLINGQFSAFCRDVFGKTLEEL